MLSNTALSLDGLPYAISSPTLNHNDLAHPSWQLKSYHIFFRNIGKISCQQHYYSLGWSQPSDQHRQSKISTWVPNADEYALSIAGKPASKSGPFASLIIISLVPLPVVIKIYIDVIDIFIVSSMMAFSGKLMDPQNHFWIFLIRFDRKPCLHALPINSDDFRIFNDFIDLAERIMK